MYTHHSTYVGGKLLSFVTCTITIALLSTACQNSSTPINRENSLFHFQEGADPRWSSPENINGERGAGGKINQGAKGRPYIMMPPKKALELLNIEGQGIIQRIWITTTNQNPVTLRSMKIDMYWDGESKPAVSAPLGDFFGMGLSHRTPFENALFANPEGRSFNCFIPMPFRKGAKIVVTNESPSQLIDIYFDVDYTLIDQWDPANLYFHAYWHRDTATTLGEDFEILPHVTGKGRYLGATIGVISNPLYGKFWWGEGEAKIFKDGDKDYPTLVGTGTEDFIGTGWGQRKFIQNYTGCTLADTARNYWGFYRYHVKEPVFFRSDCKVTIQQMGGTWAGASQRMQEAGVPMIPVTTGDDSAFTLVYNKKTPLKLDSVALNNAWINFFRSDDVSATAYFYLDKPTDSLPALQPLEDRIIKM
jgi:hypothetical protein